MTEQAGKKNGYKCKGCGWRIVTVNACEGTTPFMVGCENPAPTEEEKRAGKDAQGFSGSKGCGAFMESFFYQVPQHLEPSHEWYSPDKQERKRLRRKGQAETLEHVERGGLLLRRVGQADMAARGNEMLAKKRGSR